MLPQFLARSTTSGKHEPATLVKLDQALGVFSSTHDPYHPVVELPRPPGLDRQLDLPDAANRGDNPDHWLVFSLSPHFIPALHARHLPEKNMVFSVSQVTPLARTDPVVWLLAFCEPG